MDCTGYQYPIEFSKILTSTVIYSQMDDTAEKSQSFLIKLIEGQSHKEENNVMIYYDVSTVS